MQGKHADNSASEKPQPLGLQTDKVIDDDFIRIKDCNQQWMGLLDHPVKKTD